MPPFAKREIKRSFIKLLNERPISQITVKEIVEDCGVNRNSFYYHFQDIPSLLEEICKEVTDKVLNSMPDNCKIEDRILTVLKIFVDHKKAVYHVYSSGGKQFYEQYFLRICEYVTRSYIGSREYSSYISGEDREYIVSFLKSVMYGQMIDWFSHDMSYDIMAHAKRLCEMFAGTITAVCSKIRTSNELVAMQGIEVV